jgi:hypothetical protein
MDIQDSDLQPSGARFAAPVSSASSMAHDMSVRHVSASTFTPARELKLHELPGTERPRSYSAQKSPSSTPGGRFFSDGTTLLSAGEDGLSLWDLGTGARTGFIPGFTPAYCHPAAHELLEVSGGKLRRARHT